MIFRSQLLLPLLLAGLCAAMAHGEMTVSGSATKPGDVRFEFDATEDTGNITISHRGTGAFRQAGQAFTVTAPLLPPRHGCSLIILHSTQKRP